MGSPWPQACRRRRQADAAAIRDGFLSDRIGRVAGFNCRGAASQAEVVIGAAIALNLLNHDGVSDHGRIAALLNWTVRVPVVVTKLPKGCQAGVPGMLGS